MANGGLRVAGGTSVDVDMTPYVPAGTTAVAVNLTTDQSTAPGFLTGYPCDRPRQEVSNVNHAAGAPRGALAVVPLSASGHLCVFTLATGHVIVDLQGAFVPDAPDGVRFTPLATPDRLLDTRNTGRAPIVVVDVPDGAEAVAVNITATEVTSPGWLKAFPCGGTPPDVSNVNYLPGDSVASAAFVPVAADGTICVQSLNPVDVVVDLTGVFSRRRRPALRADRSDADARHASGHRRLDALPRRRSGARRARRAARSARRHRHDHARRAAAAGLAEGLPVRDPSRRRRRSTPPPRPCSPTP